MSRRLLVSLQVLCIEHTTPPDTGNTCLSGKHALWWLEGYTEHHAMTKYCKHLGLLKSRRASCLQACSHSNECCWRRALYALCILAFHLLNKEKV